MGIRRLFPTKDTFITDFVRLGTHQTGSNVGSCEILHLFSIGEVSTSIGVFDGSLARILSRFEVSDFQSATGSLASGTVSYFLRMKNTVHDKTLPSSFDIEVFQASEDWDEGRGRDVDAFLDKGYANWDKAKSDTLWSTPGGVWATSPVSTMHFDHGNEDLWVDVTPHVESWLDDTDNFGFLLKLPDDQEGHDYYVKMFHSRETHFPDYAPYLEARWDSFVEATGSLTGSVTYASGDGTQYFVSLKNLRTSYRPDDQTRLRMFVRDRDYNPAVVLTASLGPTGLVVQEAYYSVRNERTDAVVVPFGTGSLQHTRISYDVSGSFFDFDMSNLPPGEVYRFAFLFAIDGRKHLIDDGFKFRVY